jgi:adenylate cyclase
LTEAFVTALGPQRGAEALPVQLNRIYDALVAEVDAQRGSVLTFSGDAITCWFDDNGDGGWGGGSVPSAAHRATTSALAMQAAMAAFASVDVPGVGSVALAVKVAVAVGPVVRFVVGDAAIQTIDVLAGETLQRLARAEHLAERGEVLIDESAAQVLTAPDRADGGAVDGSAVDGDALAWRTDAETGERFAAVHVLRRAVLADPWPALDDNAATNDLLRSWLLPPVAARLFSGAGEFLTELRPAVSMFVRFGGIDFDNDPEAETHLSGFIGAVQDVLRRYESYVLQLTIGDKGSYLNTSFGAPVAHGDDIVRAVTAALELRYRQWEVVGELQIGIAQGHLRTGAYGGVTRRTYGVLGDEVNLAARLMTAAAPGEVIVDQAVRKGASDTFAWETLAPLQVKGKTTAIRASRLVGVAEHDAVGLRQINYALPMVGREEELALTVEKLTAAQNGRGQVIGIAGEAGMGKSRLVAEVVREAERLGFAVFGGHCQSFGTNASYLVWQDVIRGVLHVDPRRERDDQIRDLSATLAAIDPATAARAPLLGPVVNLAINDNELTATFDPALRKASLESLLVDAVRSRAKDEPILLVLEDTHWIDPLSSDLLDAVARACGDIALCLLAVYRSFDVESNSGATFGFRLVPWFTEVALSVLSPDGIATLVNAKLEQLFPTADIDRPTDGLVDELRIRSQGNPFYVEELLHFFSDRGLDPRDPGSLERLDLPDSLFSLILGRIDHLTEDQKTALKVASVIGRIFRVAMLTGVYPPFADREGLRADLDLLFEMEITLLEEPEPELSYLFKHVLTQEVAYETLSFATRAMLHEQIGRYIEATRAEDLDTQLDLLAHHYDLSENMTKRCEFLLRAAVSAKTAGANLSAISYFRRVLPLVTEHDRVDVLLQYGQVQELVGEWNDADSSNHEALELATTVGDDPARARAEFALGVLERKRGSYAEAVRWLSQSHDHSTMFDDTLGRSRATAELAEVDRLQGRYGEAAGLFERSAQLARTIVEENARKSALAHALKGAAAVAAGRGDYATAKRYNSESVGLRRSLSDKHGVAVLLNNQGIIARFEQDLNEARTFNEESAALFREVGDRWALGQLLNNQACVAADQRDYDGAVALLEESLIIRRQLGDRAGLALSLNTLADVLIDQGRFADAVAPLDESFALSRDLGDFTAIAYLVEDYSGVAAWEGKVARALRFAGFSEGVREQIGAKLPPSEALRVERLLAPTRITVADPQSSEAWATGRRLGQALNLDALFTDPAL